MMHTYHLYFSLLLNRTEKQQLAAQLQTLSKDMLRASAAQLDALAGTEQRGRMRQSAAQRISRWVLRYRIRRFRYRIR